MAPRRIGLALDLSILRIGCLGCDVCHLHGFGIYPGGVQGFGCQIDRVVRRKGIELGCKRPGSPYVLIPAMTEDPFAGLCPLGTFLHAAQAFLFRCGFTVDLLQSKGVMLQMQMRVGEAWQNHAAAEIFLFRIWILRREILEIANCQDPFPVDYHRGGCGPGRVLGANMCVIKEFHVNFSSREFNSSSE